MLVRINNYDTLFRSSWCYHDNTTCSRHWCFLIHPDLKKNGRKSVANFDFSVTPIPFFKMSNKIISRYFQQDQIFNVFETKLLIHSIITAKLCNYNALLHRKMIKHPLLQLLASLCCILILLMYSILQGHHAGDRLDLLMSALCFVVHKNISSWPFLIGSLYQRQNHSLNFFLHLAQKGANIKIPDTMFNHVFWSTGYNAIPSQLNVSQVSRRSVHWVLSIDST